MDWQAAIERNTAALKRIVATLVAMSGLGPEARGEPRRTLPRHLHRAVLRLLRPAESAARRLIIIMARNETTVAVPPARLGRRAAKPKSTLLRRPGGTGIFVRPGLLPVIRPAPRPLPFQLLDPLRSPFRQRQPARSSVPRISFPGFTTPFPVAPRLPLTRNDPLDATRLTLRLRALAAALDDLPALARRFARWNARRESERTAPRNSRRIQRIVPLRHGRPPGGHRRPTHEIHKLLAELHGLAFLTLERRDTS